MSKHNVRLMSGKVVSVRVSVESGNAGDEEFVVITKSALPQTGHALLGVQIHEQGAYDILGTAYTKNDGTRGIGQRSGMQKLVGVSVAALALYNAKLDGQKEESAIQSVLSDARDYIAKIAERDDDSDNRPARKAATPPTPATHVIDIVGSSFKHENANYLFSSVSKDGATYRINRVKGSGRVPEGQMFSALGHWFKCTKHIGDSKLNAIRIIDYTPANEPSKLTTAGNAGKAGNRPTTPAGKVKSSGVVKSTASKAESTSDSARIDKLEALLGKIADALDIE